MKYISHQKGFSLVELAVTMVILGLLLGGIVIPISDSFQNSQKQSNKERLNAAKEAIIGFALTHKRLPCPTDVWSGAGEGEEPDYCKADPNSGSFNKTTPNRVDRGILSGVIPWNTLGTQRDDAHGNPIYYVVESRLTISSKPSSDTSNDQFFRELAINNGPPSTPANKQFSITISSRNESDNNNKVALAKNVAALVISLGKNNNLSPDANNTTIINNLIGDEKTNVTNCCKILPFDNKTTATEFYARNYNGNKDTKDNSGNTIGAFDDQVLWIPWYQLIGVMTQTGRLQ